MKARRQRGAVLFMFAVALLMLAALCGFVLDLSLAFQRASLLRQLADGVALAAAQQLNGTPGGINSAYQRALAVSTGRTVPGVGLVVINDATLSFAASAAGPWKTRAEAAAAPAGLRFVRADTSQLDASYRTVTAFFSGLLGSALADANLGVRAVAGPQSLQVLPLAVCALSATPSAVRTNGSGPSEIVEYGFRRGVGYNLLKLNPAAGAATGEYLLVDPLQPPGATASAATSEDAVLAPFMCAGRLAYSAAAGLELNLRRNAGFNLWQQLNSRFGSYGGSNACDPYAAPPDLNVRAYVGAQASWMNSAPPQASAASSTPAAGKPLATVADPPAVLPAIAPAQYGTLWAYSAPPTPAGVPIGANQWGALYPAAPALAASGWSPGTPPYGNSSQSTAPAIAGRKERRLLHVPLLACPLPSGTLLRGTALALGRFLLTAPASASEVPAEFGGVASEDTLAADVELLP